MMMMCRSWRCFTFEEAMVLMMLSRSTAGILMPQAAKETVFMVLWYRYSFRCGFLLGCESVLYFVYDSRKGVVGDGRRRRRWCFVMPKQAFDLVYDAGFWDRRQKRWR